MPDCMCSAMWQWVIHRPGLVTCMGWSESISFTSRSLTRSPTVKCQSIAGLSVPLVGSTNRQCMVAAVVARLTSTMSSFHSMPSASPWSMAAWSISPWSIAGLGRAERSDLAVGDQQVVEREDQVAVGGRPVAGVGGGDQDVAVQAQLLGVVLADVGVVPVQAGIGELDPVGEAATHRDRGLGLVSPRCLATGATRRSRVSPGGQLQHLGPAPLGQPGGVGRERLDGRRGGAVVVVGSLHDGVSS